MDVFVSRSPISGEFLFSRAAMSRDAALALIAQTRVAQQAWRKLAQAARCEFLLRLANLLEIHKNELAALTQLEIGRLPQECRAEIDKSAALARYYAECAPRLLAQKTILTTGQSFVHFEPLGVILGVMPWNYPVWQILRFALPALVAGNACVFKPAPSVPQTSAKLAEILELAGLGELAQMLWIDVDDVEAAIAATDGVAFTGSTATGRKIAALAGKHLKKSVLELGGSNPLIVFEDADLKAAAQAAAMSRFRDAGQSCNAAKRLILLPKIAEEFLELFLIEAKKFHFGDANTATLAPLARADLREHLHAQVLDALQHGARCLLGGELPQGAGYFYPATVLDQVNEACRLFREESFGPVASVIRARDEADALRLANATPFGLGVSIFSQRNTIFQECGQDLEFGSVFLNRHTSSDVRLPFGGVKDSGYGRELSEFGIYEFVNIKTYWASA